MNSELLPHTPWTRLRSVVNWLNLSTPLGLFVARLGGSTLTRRGRGSYLAGGYRCSFPAADAFTLGSVILSRHEAAWLRDRPALVRHEDRHCSQYGWCLGVPLVPLYGLAAGASWLVAGDPSSYNPFERWADLADGGYPPPATRLARRS